MVVHCACARQVALDVIFIACATKMNHIPFEEHIAHGKILNQNNLLQIMWKFTKLNRIAQFFPYYKTTYNLYTRTKVSDIEVT